MHLLREHFSDDDILQAAREVMDQRVAYGTVFDSPTRVKDFLVTRLGAETREHFMVMFLSAQHAMIASEIMFSGTLSQTSVYPREVVRRALELNAAAVILAHNHPSGQPEPSRADEYLTKTLRDALKLIDVRVLDHGVVAASRTVSFAERGLM